MAGANYMGGKRNAAKARSRDTTTRVQKGFFGRQRLHLPLKGLAARSRALAPKSVLAESATLSTAIDLAHARRHSETTRKFMPDIIRVPLYTPERRFKPLCHLSSSSAAKSSRSRSSKVLDALDTSEPLFIRAELDRILALPDLAGLSKNHPTPPTNSVKPLLKRRRTRSPSPCSSPNRGKRQKMISRNSHLPSGPAAELSPAHKDPSGLPYPNKSPDPVPAKQLVPDQDPPVLVTLPAVARHFNRYDTIEMEDIQQDLEDEYFEPVDFDDSALDDDSGYCESRTSFSPLSLWQSGSNEYVLPLSEANFSPGAFRHDDQSYRPQKLMLDMDTSLPDSSVSSQIARATSQHSSPSSLGLWLPQVPEPRAPIPRLPRPGLNYGRTNFPSRSSPGLHHVSDFSGIQRSRFASLVPPPPSPFGICDLSSPFVQASVLRPRTEPSLTFDSEASCKVDLSPHFAPADKESGCNLLDHDDPWKVVGRLLGYEEKERAASNTNALDGLIINDRRGVGYVEPQADQCQRIPSHVDETNEESLQTFGWSKVTEVHEPDPQNDTHPCRDDSLELRAPTTDLMDLLPSNSPRSNESSSHPERPISVLVSATKTTNISSMVLGPCLFSDDGPGESEDGED